METKARITPQIVLGLIIIAVGVLFTLDNMDLIYARDYLRYWPALLLLYGIVRLAQPSGTPGRFMGLVFTFAGGALLLDRLDVFDFSVWSFWPLLLVILGLTLVFRASKRMDASRSQASESSATVNGFALLGGTKRTNNSQDFQGGELTAVMGGCEIDLRQASIKGGDPVIDVFAFWGGIEIKVPEDWSVDVQGTPLLGGFEDKTRPPKGGSNRRLVVKGYAIMGGVEIMN